MKAGKVTVPAGQSVGVCNSILQLVAQSNTVMIYASPESGLMLMDGWTPDPDPPVLFPMEFPFIVDSTSEDVFVFNPGTVPVVITAIAWKR